MTMAVNKIFSVARSGHQGIDRIGGVHVHPHRQSDRRGRRDEDRHGHFVEAVDEGQQESTGDTRQDDRQNDAPEDGPGTRAERISSVFDAFIAITKAAMMSRMV